MSQALPNILHIFTDMQRADTIHALGNPVIKTPNLDRLCREGVAFTNAFSPSPVCISARCSMIFGQEPHQTGCYENTLMPTDERQTFMQALTDAGYRTHGIGKCHFTPDALALRGFETREVQEEGGASVDELDRHDYLKYLYDRGYRHICEAQGIRGEMYYIPQPSQLPATHHPTQWIGDRSVAFLKAQQATDRPWYLFSSFIHPHPPLTPPTPWHKLYRPASMPLPHVPQQSEALLSFVNRVQNRYKYRDQGTDLNLLRIIKAYYYACISFVDFQIGRLLKALEQSGQLDNTLILFTSDHGELLGDYNSFGKRSMHDASARVPLIAREPGRFEGGLVCDTPVSLIDLSPTFLSAAETSISTHEMTGEDLAEVAAGTCSREMVFSQLGYTCDAGKAAQRRGAPTSYTPAEEIASRSSYMAVSRNWKYVYSAPDDREWLFDRVHDPAESRNCKGVVFCRKALQNMKTALLDHLGRGGETVGLDRDDWRNFPRLEMDDDPDTGLLIQDMYTPWAEMRIPGYTDDTASGHADDIA
ncbi:MAG: sulfatase-like hydrolase/transferase [bacterium]|nr:sulfatase-like hydrolase/transferase [bacterium]